MLLGLPPDPNGPRKLPPHRLPGAPQAAWVPQGKESHGFGLSLKTNCRRGTSNENKTGPQGTCL